MSRSRWRKLSAVGLVVAALSLTGAAGATWEGDFFRGGGGHRAASLSCPGGMTRLGHPFAEDMSVFPFDPAIHLDVIYTVADDFFKVEDIDTGAHAGTHIDVPAHFIEGGRTLDELAADEFVWPVYKIEVAELGLDPAAEPLFVEKEHIRAYERAHGRIPRRGALVVLETGLTDQWGVDDPGDELGYTDDDLADNTDDFFDYANAGFSGEAVQWLFDERNIDGIGSDAYGPDAYNDPDYIATYTALYNDGIALVALANLDSVNVTGDLVIAPTVALEDGSGFSTDPIACHGTVRRRSRG